MSIELKTPNKLEYKFYKFYNGFQFSVRAKHDAFICLSKEAKKANPIIEIVIGGGGNTKSFLRYDGKDAVVSNTPNILDAKSFKAFWVRETKGVVTVGQKGKEAAFISWKIPKPFTINYVGVCTSYGATGSWILEQKPKVQPPKPAAPVKADPPKPAAPAKVEPPKPATAAKVEDPKPTEAVKTETPKSEPLVKDEIVVPQSEPMKNGKIEFKTPDQHKYKFFPFRNGIVQFRARAKNDLFICLSGDASEKHPIIEINIGGWKNTKSMMRFNNKEPFVSECQTPNILDAEAFKGFWIRVTQSIVTVGREGIAAPFLTWDNPNPFVVNYFGVCTGGATGSWIIGVPQMPVKDEIIVSEPQPTTNEKIEHNVLEPEEHTIKMESISTSSRTSGSNGEDSLLQTKKKEKSDKKRRSKSKTETKDSLSQSTKKEKRDKKRNEKSKAENSSSRSIKKDKKDKKRKRSASSSSSNTSSDIEDSSPLQTTKKEKRDKKRRSKSKDSQSRKKDKKDKKRKESIKSEDSLLQPIKKDKKHKKRKNESKIEDSQPQTMISEKTTDSQGQTNLDCHCCHCTDKRQEQKRKEEKRRKKIKSKQKNYDV